MTRLLLLAASAAVLTACSSSTPAAQPAAAPPTSPAARGDLSQARLSAMLLQPADLPDLPTRRQFASADLGTQATPQLALCHPAVVDAPHQLANVLAESGTPGQVKVFEVVSAYADEAAAQAAYARAVEDARGCAAYDVQGVSYAVQDLADVEVGPGVQAVHYRLTTPAVVSGDVRTLARSGRFTVLVSGFGAPPAGQPLLDYQAAVMRKALARLA